MSEKVKIASYNVRIPKMEQSVGMIEIKLPFVFNPVSVDYEKFSNAIQVTAIVSTNEGNEPKTFFFVEQDKIVNLPIPVDFTEHIGSFTLKSQIVHVCLKKNIIP